MELLKIIANVTGLADFWSKYFGKKQDQETGAELQQGKNDAAALKVISNVTRPGTRAERDRLWDQNESKFGPDRRPSG